MRSETRVVNVPLAVDLLLGQAFDAVAQGGSDRDPFVEAVVGVPRTAHNELVQDDGRRLGVLGELLAGGGLPCELDELRRLRRAVEERSDELE